MLNEEPNARRTITPAVALQVWRRDPGRETEGYYIFLHRLQEYRPIHYIEEDRLWVYIAVDEANKWYTIKPVPLGLGVGPTRLPATPIDVDQPEDPPAEGSQNTDTTSLTIIPPTDPTTMITATDTTSLTTVHPTDPTTTITQPVGTIPSGTATIPMGSGHQQEHRLLPGFLLVPSRKAVQVAQVHKSNIGLLFNINFNNINLFD